MHPADMSVLQRVAVRRSVSQCVEGFAGRSSIHGTKCTHANAHGAIRKTDLSIYIAPMFLYTQHLKKLNPEHNSSNAHDGAPAIRAGAISSKSAA